MASIKDVAKEAGVSVSTVSNYLNQRRLRPGTAERVRQAIEKLDYAQNYAARSLVKGHSHILGLIVSDIMNLFFTDMTRRFLDQALIMDMETIVMNTNYDPNRTLNCVRRLISLQVPGVAVLTSEVVPPVSRQMLAQKEIGAVYLDVDATGPWCSSVLVDYMQGVRQAVEHLRSLGHERIGFIAGPRGMGSVDLRQNAFVESMSEEMRGSLPIIDSDGSFQGGYYCCSKMLAMYNPTALICVNDRAAMGAFHCAHDRGIRIPEELSIVGFDNTAVSNYTEPPMTTIFVHRGEIVRLALEAIFSMSESPDHMGKTYAVGTELVVRESTGPVRKE